MSKISFSRCNEYRHLKRDCPIKQKNKRKERIKPHTIEEIGEPEKKSEKRRYQGPLLLKKESYLSRSM